MWGGKASLGKRHVKILRGTQKQSVFDLKTIAQPPAQRNWKRLFCNNRSFECCTSSWEALWDIHKTSVDKYRGGGGRRWTLSHGLQREDKGSEVCFAAQTINLVKTIIFSRDWELMLWEWWREGAKFPLLLGFTLTEFLFLLSSHKPKKKQGLEADFAVMIPTWTSWLLCELLSALKANVKLSLILLDPIYHSSKITVPCSLSSGFIHLYIRKIKLN